MFKLPNSCDDAHFITWGALLPSSTRLLTCHQSSLHLSEHQCEHDPSHGSRPPIRWAPA